MSETQLISEMERLASTIEAYNSDIIELDDNQLMELESKRDTLLNSYFNNYMPNNVVRLF